MSKIVLSFPSLGNHEFEKGVLGNDIVKKINPSLSAKALALKISGAIKDLAQPVTESGPCEILTFDSQDGKAVYWHSTAHVMATAVKELKPGVKLAIGPPIENGFYYDFDSEENFTPEDLAQIEKKMAEIIHRDEKFIREEIDHNQAASLFKQEKYKLELISEFEDRSLSIYRNGSFVDLCRGPHLPSTGRINSVKLLSVAGAYWRGKENNPMLQRIYGISFPDSKALEDYLVRLEESKKRDHRKLGKTLELFLMTPAVGNGLPLWLPRGTVLREILESFLRQEQKQRGYQPVITPHIGNIEMYKTSGHYPYYKDSQFSPIKMNGEEYLLKPMNCPHHFQIYSSKPRSYRDLPLRLAEFGTVYRYEQSGELNGLVRVRSFTVDDSHMFVREDQIQDEVGEVIKLIQLVFSTLGFKEVKAQLSFRDPADTKKFAGDGSLWDKGQAAIKQAADHAQLSYQLAYGEAAFYGPKIDFMIKDALGRHWQLGTVQIDYIMPERFNLEYVGQDNCKHRPVVIHRAPFGSMERFIGILIEHFAGEFPLWLSPVQVIIIPVSEKVKDYALSVLSQLEQARIRVEIDQRNETLGYKIRDNELQKIPYMIIVGEKEKQNQNITVRQRKKGNLGQKSIAAFMGELNELIQNKFTQEVPY